MGSCPAVPAFFSIDSSRTWDCLRLGVCRVRLDSMLECLASHPSGMVFCLATSLGWVLADDGDSGWTGSLVYGWCRLTDWRMPCSSCCSWFGCRLWLLGFRVGCCVGQDRKELVSWQGYFYARELLLDIDIAGVFYSIVLYTGMQNECSYLCLDIFLGDLCSVCAITTWRLL